MLIELVQFIRSLSSLSITMDEEDDLDKMLRVLSAPDPSRALEAMAFATGFINPHGSFLSDDEATLDGGCRELTVNERREKLRALPYVYGAEMPAPTPPPQQPACSAWVPEWQHSLRPTDYCGLGVDADGVFRIPSLKRHCTLAPGSVDCALACALAAEGRELRCQALRCSRSLRSFEVCQLRVCSLCLMGVYCGECAPVADAGKTLCRVCLLYSTVGDVPMEWMWRRAQTLRKTLDHGGVRATDSNAACWETVITLMAPRAVRDAVHRLATQPPSK